MLGFLDGHWGPKLKSPLLEQWALYPLRNFLQFWAFLLWALLVSRWGWWVHAVRKHKLFGRAIALAWTISLISTDSESLYASADHLTLEVATGGPQKKQLASKDHRFSVAAYQSNFLPLGKRTEQIQKELRVCRRMDAGRDPKSHIWQMVPGDMSQDVERCGDVISKDIFYQMWSL